MLYDTYKHGFSVFNLNTGDRAVINFKKEYKDFIILEDGKIAIVFDDGTVEIWSDDHKNQAIESSLENCVIG